MKVALVCIAALVIGTTSAAGARSVASPFELVVSGYHEAVPESPAFPFGTRHRGTFVASPPFCSSGVYWDLTNDLLNSFEDTRLYTCSDGSGTLTTMQEDWFEHKPPFTSSWRITAGTGLSADLRGKGTYRGELLAGNLEDLASILYRCAFTGLVAFDALAPTIVITAAAVTRRSSSTFSIAVSVTARDNDTANAVSWLVAVEPAGGGLYLAQKRGSTSTGRARTTLRIRPPSGARKILVHARAEDPVGNWRWVTRSVKLPG